MSVRRPVLVGFEFTPEGEEALRQGHALSRAHGTRLLVTHVLPDLRQRRLVFPHLAATDADSLDALREVLLDDLSERTRSLAGSDPAEFDVSVTEGSPHARLLEQADDVSAGIVVLGAGDLGLRVARHARCPALLARASADGEVVAATDLSDPSLPAISMAASEALRRGRHLTVVHCIDPGELALPTVSALPGAAGGAPLVPLLGAQLDEMRAASEERLAEALEKLGVIGRPVVLDGPPARMIPRFVQQVPVELLVVASHGRTGFLRFALGSVAEDLVRATTCPVLVVRGRAAGGGGAD